MRKIKNKKALSVMIGYVLLITLAVVMGGIIYQWMKSYVPRDLPACPEGTSILLKDYIYECNDNLLTLTLKNNGRFNIAGYFIRATTSETQKIANKSLVEYLDEEQGGKKFGSSIVFATGGNSMEPNAIKRNTFNLASAPLQKIYFLEIIPTRFQEREGKNEFTSCSDAKIKQKVKCCIHQTCASLGYVCGTHDEGCGGTLNCRTCNIDAGEECKNGICVAGGCVPESIPVTCGAWICGTKTNNCGDIVSCPPGCNEGKDCDATGQCVATGTTYCGNENCDGGEICGDTNVALECNSDCGACVTTPVNSCASYCATFEGYSNGGCVQNPNQCSGLTPPKTYIGNIPGANPTVGNGYCNVGNTDTCCCQP